MASLFIFEVEDTSTPQTISIPDPSTAGLGAEVIIKDHSGGAGANNITVVPDGGLIDGQASTVISSDYGVVHLSSDGREWIVIATNGEGGGTSNELTVTPVRTLNVRGTTIDNGFDDGGLGNYTRAGSGVGKTLTCNSDAALVVDDVTYEVGDRFLFRGRNDGSSTVQKDHGIYVVTDAGEDGVRPWVLTRAADFDSDSEAVESVVIDVAEGSVGAGTSWVTATTGSGIDSGLRIFLWPYFATEITAARANLGPGGAQIGGDVLVGGNLTAQALTAQGSTINLRATGLGSAFLRSANTVTIEGGGGADPDVQRVSINAKKVSLQETSGFLLAEYGGDGAAQMAFVDTVDTNAKAVAFCEALRLYLIARGTINNGL